MGGGWRKNIPFLSEIREKKNICPLTKEANFHISISDIILLLMLHCYCTATPKQRV